MIEISGEATSTSSCHGRTAFDWACALRCVRRDVSIFSLSAHDHLPCPRRALLGRGAFRDGSNGACVVVPVVRANRRCGHACVQCRINRADVLVGTGQSAIVARGRVRCAACAATSHCFFSAHDHLLCPRRALLGHSSLPRRFERRTLRRAGCNGPSTRVRAVPPHSQGRRPGSNRTERECGVSASSPAGVCTLRCVHRNVSLVFSGHDQLLPA